MKLILIYRLSLLGLFLLARMAFAAEAPQAIPTGGAPFASPLLAVEPGWNLVFATAGKRVVLPAGDLARWGAFVDSSAGPQVLLSGGGVLVADVIAVTDEYLQVDSLLLGTAKIPRDAVVGVLFHPAADRMLRDRMYVQVAAASGETDRLILDNGDQFSGKLVGLAGESLSMETSVGKVAVELSRAAALVFDPRQVEKPAGGGLCCMVGLRDGSRLLATSLLVDETGARLETAGVTLQTRADNIVALQPLGGKSVFLSDMKPDSYKHIPFLQTAWPYHADRSTKGSLLRADGRLYLKGLGMHSASRITYDLDRPYQSFQAELAIDDETAGRGSVVCRVFVDDGTGKWTSRYSSPTIRGGQSPIPISVDLNGAKRISLLVDFADRGDELDHVDWLSARLVR